MKNVFRHDFDWFGRDMSLFCNCRFKGGGDDPPSSNIADTKESKYAAGQLYPMYGRGIKGKGLMPASLDRALQKRESQGLQKAFAGARQDMNSDLSRILSRGDHRSRNAINTSFNEAQISARAGSARAERMRDVGDVDTARDMAFAATSNERRIGASAMQSYNSAVARNTAMERQYGTFGTNLAGGVGSGMTALYFAQGMGKQANA